MNVATPVPPTMGQAHARACNEVNRWRGHCVERFARLERHAGAALAAMTAAGGGKGKVPHMFGDRIRALAMAVAPDGPHPDKRIARALDQASDLFEHRNRLVHATARVLLDRKGEWVWHFRFWPPGKPEEIGCLDEKDALAMEGRLRRTSQSLCGQLDSLAAKLKSG